MQIWAHHTPKCARMHARAHTHTHAHIAERNHSVAVNPEHAPEGTLQPHLVIGL